MFSCELYKDFCYVLDDLYLYMLNNEKRKIIEGIVKAIIKSLLLKQDESNISCETLHHLYIYIYNVSGRHLPSYFPT